MSTHSVKPAVPVGDSPKQGYMARLALGFTASLPVAKALSVWKSTCRIGQ